MNAQRPESSMKLAFSTNAFTRMSLAKAIKEIAIAGYSGVEILADKPHWYPDHFSRSQALVIRRQLEKSNLRVSNINANCTFGFWKDAPPEPFFEPSLISPQRALRAARKQMIFNALQFAHALGADNISITSGKLLPTMPPEKARPVLMEALKEILEKAEQLNIRVGIECEPMLFIEWAAELRELIDDVNSPLLGANLDIGHAVVQGEPIAKILKLLQGRIWNCHIEDIAGRKHYHLIPGEGTLNWHALKKALMAINYDRFLTVELYTCVDQPVAAAQKSIAFLKRLYMPVPE
ncbi:MAG: sugar phosphate isomerase/epimerase family protein [Phycisphaerae bacterium]